MRGNVVDLAVGVVIGTAFNSIVTSLVNDVITPPLGLLLGKVDFSELVINLGGSSEIHYGLFIQAIISFVITAVALFLIIRFMARLQRKAKEQPSTAPPKNDEVVLLEEIRDLLKSSKT